jgi:phosphoglycerate kinase
LNKYTIRDLAVKGKRVFIRVDFNVPVDDAGRIASDNRITAALPTINYLREQGGIPILASHFGRPKGVPNLKYSLRPVAERLSELLNRPIKFAPDCIGPEALKAVRGLVPGDVLLLENLRFHAEEEKNDLGFARALAGLADFYVNDAFGAAHRAHASTEGMARLFPAPAAGLLMEKEINYLGRVLEFPVRPFVAIIGGAKFRDKLGVIRNLVTKVDRLLLGGGLVFNFLKAQGLEIGSSLHEDGLLEETRALLKETKIQIPTDVVIGNRTDAAADARNVTVREIARDWIGLDIGAATAEAYRRLITPAKTIIWSGPMGMFELDQFAGGTQAVAQAVAEATAKGALSVVGGGDTGAALSKFDLKKQVSHVSTGGGACLEFLEGRNLPAVAVLKDKA